MFFITERSYAEIREAVTAELKKTFRPEFLNRIDEIIVFHRLTGEELSPEQRQTSFTSMMKIALETAVKMAAL